MPRVDDDQLLSVAEVAQRWYLAHRTVQRRIAQGQLAAVRLPGGHYRVRRRDVVAAFGHP